MQFSVVGLRRMQSVSLTVEASDAVEAQRRAEAEGCAVLVVRPLRSRRGFAAAAGGFPLLQFNQSLLILLQAGLSIVEAIETLTERETRDDARQVLARVREQLGSGLSFSAALEAQPAVFPPLYVASVRANEKTGALVEAIERFIAYRAQAELMRRRVVSASIYPAMILAVGLLVIAFLLLYVVPRFSLVFQDLGERVPLMSRLLLEWGRFAHAHGVELLAAGGLGAAAVAWALAQPAVRAALFRQVQRIPRIGEWVRIYQLARFYRALGMLQRAGIPILAALDMVNGLLPPGLQPALAAARRDIGAGRSVSQAFEAQGLTTAVSLRLLRVAERSGQLGAMLEKSAVFHDEDIAQAIDWFVRLFEPLLMIVIGIVIGGVVLLMYAPIFELAGSLQ
ncbi:MAG TPA: type II secretion system F family protein [Methylibium sp.]|nr:type II secretion system F family protein [Methylibium sp.]